MRRSPRLRQWKRLKLPQNEQSLSEKDQGEHEGTLWNGRHLGLREGRLCARACKTAHDQNANLLLSAGA